MDKAKSKSKSMEEISRISTINTGLARTHATRLSLPSQSYTKKRVHPGIMDVDPIEEEDDRSVTIEIGQEPEMMRTSQISKKSHRSRAESLGSKTNRTRKESNANKSRRNADYENRAYDSHLDGISVISSARGSSMQSLEVQREQYCCFSKWSPFERKLGIVIVVLITIILVLAVIVAVLAGNRDIEESRRLSILSW